MGRSKFLFGVETQVNLCGPLTVRQDRPIRILHVLGRMDLGGVETWLMQVLRNIDRERFRMDFVVHTDEPSGYDDELRSLGSALYHCPTPSNPVRYGRNFLHILRKSGPFDVVHSHVHHFSGFVLRLAKAAGVAQRIAHSHTDTALLDDQSSLARKLYLKKCRRWIAQNAGTKLAASGLAANSLFGPSWAGTTGASVLYCGIDLKPFDPPVDRAAVRSELGLGPDHFVVGHVGRFDPSKNHDFLLRIHNELRKINPRAILLLVGKGPLEQNIRGSARALGILESVRFAGMRADIPRIMLGAMDVFVLPSLYEGLGLAAIEAQAAGLPTILSDRIPLEADAGCGLVRFVSIDKSEAFWSQEILRHFQQERISQAQAAMQVKKTHFNIDRSVEKLASVYQGSQHS